MTESNEAGLRMAPLDARAVEDALGAWQGRRVYIHLEVNPGAYWRNGSGRLDAAHVRGDGPYRLFLRVDGGLLQIDALTHMAVAEGMVVCTGYDDLQRLARTVEVGLEPFAL